MKKITTTALLFFLALFTLTTCLVAQESGQARKQGWFVGVSPYFLGAEIKTTTENTTLTERYTEGTRNLIISVTFTASTTDQAEGQRSDDGSTVYSSDYDNIAMSAVLEVCEDATYTGAGTYTAFNFDATSNTGTAATPNTDISACYNYFQGLAAFFSPSLTGVILDSTFIFFYHKRKHPINRQRLATRLQL